LKVPKKLTEESRLKLKELIKEHNMALKRGVERQYQGYESASVGCNSEDEISLRNQAMKRFSYLSK